MEIKNTNKYKQKVLSQKGIAVLRAIAEGVANHKVFHDEGIAPFFFPAPSNVVFLGLWQRMKDSVTTKPWNCRAKILTHPEPFCHSKFANG
ncbi:hypothetical protein [Ferrovum sp.]|uniref:hypothetical protein n=1 Tax=Ferrovum sp. TaxID=2609467 RepID=UPI0026387044|nr:hypothetical protein [Ferrovum sp.]